MYSFMGIGTTLYGEKNYDKINHFYTATEWLVFLLLPIAPIKSYRVRRVKTKLTFNGFIGANSQYEMNKIPLDKKQVITTYLTTYGIIALLFVSIGYLPELIPYIIALIIALPIIFLIRSAIRRKSFF